MFATNQTHDGRGSVLPTLTANTKRLAPSRPIGSLLAATHHCCNLGSSLVVDAGQHQRGQEEEEGAGGRVNKVLQPERQAHSASRQSVEVQWGRPEFEEALPVPVCLAPTPGQCLQPFQANFMHIGINVWGFLRGSLCVCGALCWAQDRSSVFSGTAVCFSAVNYIYTQAAWLYAVLNHWHPSKTVRMCHLVVSSYSLVYVTV